MIKLVDFVKTLKDNTNVCVYTSTTHTIASCQVPDGCGNHKAIAWAETLDIFPHMAEELEIASINVEFKSYMDSPQYYVTLVNPTDGCTNRLTIESNRTAVSRAFNF